MLEESLKPIKAPQSLLVIGSTILGVFWIAFMWRFWEVGVYALGVNATVFMVAFSILLNANDADKSVFQIRHWKTVVPFGLLALSYALYENPFIKIVNIFVMPILAILFYRYTRLKQDNSFEWSMTFIVTSIVPFLSLPGLWVRSFCEDLKLVKSLLVIKDANSKIIIRIACGLCLLSLLLAFVVLPLLSSADAAFADSIRYLVVSIDRFLITLINLPLFEKALIALIISIGILALLKLADSIGASRFQSTAIEPIDSIVSGIVIAGTLIFYLLFIAIQIQKLFIVSLPINFQITESYVKGGFWQLIFVSLINLFMFIACYKRTHNIVQGVLGVFTFACLLLVCSAGHRMALYVTTYGLSYEKFYASYAVIFCVILFVYLLSGLLSECRKDVLKFTCYLFLWMYSTSTILPVEQIILRTNLWLNEMPDSRIDLNEMTMLSADVLGIVSSVQSTENFVNFRSPRWEVWQTKKLSYLNSKSLYEMNLSNLSTMFKVISNPK